MSCTTLHDQFQFYTTCQFFFLLLSPWLALINMYYGWQVRRFFHSHFKIDRDLQSSVVIYSQRDVLWLFWPRKACYLPCLTNSDCAVLACSFWNDLLHYWILELAFCYDFSSPLCSVSRLLLRSTSVRDPPPYPYMVWFVGLSRSNFLSYIQTAQDVIFESTNDMLLTLIEN
jgi:hypothetical protein